MTDIHQESEPASTAGDRRTYRRRLFGNRFGSLMVFALVFLGLSFALRVALLIREADQVDWSFISLVKSFGMGLLFDLAALSCIVGPVALLYIFLPDRFFRWKGHRIAAMVVLFLAIFAMLFDLAAEWLFWGEFTARFNFLAVDYLIYTNELIGNIVESYPVGWIFGVIGVLAVGITLLVWPLARQAFEVSSTFRRRLAQGAGFVVAPFLLLALLNDSFAELTSNRLNNELSKNGLYGLVEAFRKNTIDYKDFYLSVDDKDAILRLRTLISSPDEPFLSDNPADLRRQVTARAPEKRSNVVLFVVESLSAKFLGAFGDTSHLTPNLDKLADQSVLFTNFYATGTRTTRGLEALMLSLPPTPGRSVIKRPENANLFSLGQIFRKRGYDAVFFYGGYGYFDNMNAFFAGNGFRIVDRADLNHDEITFTNAWGVCDEDLYRRVLKEGDRSRANQTPFFHVVMTTSNHRPYSFPEGKIDLPQGNRFAAVKYTDYAIGAFLEQAKSKPWFDDTIFVIIADHCANSAGKMDVEVEKYHIPMFFYAPKLLPPRRVEKLSGQMDFAPTLLDIMGFSYCTKFFGRDILAGGQGRAVLGNYQKVGLWEGNTFTLLLPRKETRSYIVDEAGQRPAAESPDRVADTVGYYQTADYVLSHGLQEAE